MSSLSKNLTSCSPFFARPVTIVSLLLLSALSQEIMYPYGPVHRDLETPKMDDGSSTEIIILMPFIFFNNPYRSIYVSSYIPLFPSITANILEKC